MKSGGKCLFCSSTSRVNTTLERMFLTDMKHLKEDAYSADAKFPPSLIES